MRCPQCKREYRRQDFDHDETYFECDDCSLALDGAPSPRRGESQSVGSAGGPAGTSSRGVVALSKSLATPPEIARGYGGFIIVLRWLARLVDSIPLLLAYYGAIKLVRLFDISDNVAAVAVVVFWLLYFVLFETWVGRTPGKMLIGLRVVDSTGAVPGFRRAAIRAALSVIEVNPLLFGAIPAAIAVFVSPTRQRLGDLAAATYVLIEEDTARMVRPVRPLSHPTDAPN